jgi:hypothetical protein
MRNDAFTAELAKKSYATRVVIELAAETHRNGCPKTAAPIVEDVGCYNRAAVIARIPIGLIESCVEPDWAAGGVRKRRSAEAQVGIGGFRFCPIPDLSDLQL